MSWKLVKKNNFGTGLSEVYVKSPFTLEIFRDFSVRNGNTNVVIYDSRKKSYESSFGGIHHVEYLATEKEARAYAKKYMGSI